MSILTRWLLIPPVNARLIGRYRDYRRHGASAFSATLGCFWMILAWIFIPLEHPRWQRIRAEHKNLYPHINASRPRPLDPVRYLIQTCWLLIGTSRKETPKPRRRAFSGLQNIRGRYHQWMNELPERVSHKTQHLDEKKELGHLSAGARRLILGIIVTFSLILALICVTQPFNPLAQFIFLMLLWGVALIVRRMPGRFSALMLIVLSLTVSCRYIWWRYTSTLNWDDPVSLVCGLILLFAETYAWIVLVLGYFQVVWPLNRQPVPLPKDMSLWPSVDIFVPTYNEDLNVVKNTIYASLGIDWPKDKLNIWILDDGGREEFRQFAQNVGVKYIARTTHEHAKAGNINNALKYAKGEFVSIFDCDHVPTRSFLQMTMGWFLKEKQLAMMQTPHHFYSPDPFEKNLHLERAMPIENSLFHDFIQKGNDTWNAVMFCGSSAVMRRAAKTVNFGIIYGISAFGLSQRLGCPRSEAATLIENYFIQFPVVKSFMEDLVHKAEQAGYAETLLGRRRMIPEINSANKTIKSAAERTAINTPIQGTAADMIKIAMIHVDKLLEGTRSRLILQIHDELLVDLHKDETELIPKIEEAMIGALPLPNGVPILVEARTGNNWLEAH